MDGAIRWSADTDRDGLGDIATPRLTARKMLTRWRRASGPRGLAQAALLADQFPGAADLVGALPGTLQLGCRQVAAGMRMDGVRIEAVDDPDAVLPLADIVSSATMATTPLVKGALLKEGCHVDLIGGWRSDMRESDDDVIRRATLFADTRDLCRDCGDFLQPVEKGLMTWASIRADLFDLCRGSHEGRRSAGEITLFKNAGGAHLDLFTAQELLRRVRSEPEY